MIIVEIKDAIEMKLLVDAEIVTDIDIVGQEEDYIYPTRFNIETQDFEWSLNRISVQEALDKHAVS